MDHPINIKMKSLPPRPPSPTELSYTQLAKLAPRFVSTSNNGLQGVQNNRIVSNDKVRFAIDNTSAIPTAPRTAPPSTINVPSDGGNCSISTTGGIGVASSIGHNNNYQTPNTTTIHSNIMSHQFIDRGLHHHINIHNSRLIQ